jgi:hypothetical protein
MDQTHVTFRWKDRGANSWRIERLPGVEFLGRFLQHILPRGFHKVRYYGLWDPSKREQSARAWVLLILESSDKTVQPHSMVASLGEALSELMGLTDQLHDAADHEAAPPCCPHCGSCRTRLLGEYPRSGVP